MPACPPGHTLCSTDAGTFCADLQADWQNCGACGNACPQAAHTVYSFVYEAFETCTAGQCTGGCQHGWTACDDLCVTTETDPANCGACGNTCAAGDVCVEGACVDPSTLRIVVGLAGPTEVALDDTNVYWLDPDAGTVGTASKQGGPATILANGQTAPTQLFVDDTSVYWALGAGGTVPVMRVPKDGSTGPEMVVPPGEVDASFSTPFVGIDRAYIYTFPPADGPAPNFRKTPKDGGAPIDVPITVVSGVPVGVDDLGFWLLAGAGYEYMQVDTTTGAVIDTRGTDLYSGPTFVTGGALCYADGQFAFIGRETQVICRSETSSVYADSFLYPGGSLLNMTEGAHSGTVADWIAWNRCGAFWSAGGRLGMGIPGASYSVWIDASGTAHGVAVDESFIYWADSQGAIGKLAIP
jgi:hypothetical protein